MESQFFGYTTLVKFQRPMEQAISEEKRLSSKPFPWPQIG